MNRFALFFLTITLSTATAAAQPTFRLGVRGGFNRATSTLDAASTSLSSQYYYSANKSAIYAWQVGAVLEVEYHRFALQPALLFSQKGEQFDTFNSFRSFGSFVPLQTFTVSRYNWLELPLNVVYTWHAVQVFAGPYVALGIGGHQRGTVNNTYPVGILGFQKYDFAEKISYGSNTENRRLDAGVNFGVGYRNGPLQVQLGCGLGLRNLHQIDADATADSVHNFREDAAYNRVVQLTGTYFFQL